MKNRLKCYIDENRLSLEKKVLELSTIHSVTEKFALANNFPDLLNYIVNLVQSVFSAKFCNIYLKDKNGDFVFKTQKCDIEEDCNQYFAARFPIDREPFDEIKNNLKPMIINEINDEESLFEVNHFPEVGSYSVMPLFTGNNFFGILTVGLPKGQTFSEGSISLLLTIAKESSIAIENVRLYQKMSEEKKKIEAILGAISDGVISMDQNGIITSFNKAAEKITGYPKDHVIGKPCFIIFKGIHEGIEFSQNIFCTKKGCLIKEAYEQGSFPLRTEHIVITPKGERKTLEFTSTLEKDGLTGQVAFVSVFRDVSKIKELERLRSDFIDTISHELRTPLTSIKGYVSALLHPSAKFTEDESIEFLRIVNEEADRLNKLINHLLEASRLQRDTLSIKPQAFLISDYITEVIKRKQATTTLHKIISDLNGSPMVYGDPHQIEFVLTHLLDNAIKFSPEGGNIKISLKSAGRENVTVSVEDEGIGIPEDQWEKIFDLFHRVDNRSTRKIYGPGLGLFLSRKILEAHGTNIWVEGGKKHGTRIVFTLPKYADNEDKNK